MNLSYTTIMDVAPRKSQLTGDNPLSPWCCHPGRLTLAFMRSFLRRIYAKMIAGWPEPVRGQLIEVHLSSNGGRQARGERSTMPQLAGELKQGGDLPDVPVIVLTTLGVDPGMRLFASRVAARDARWEAASIRGAGWLGQPGRALRPRRRPVQHRDHRPPRCGHPGHPRPARQSQPSTRRPPGDRPGPDDYREDR